MAASRKKRAKPRAARASKKRTEARPNLTALDGEWHSFITKAAGSEPVTAEWPDPRGAASPKTVIRKSVAKKATKKPAAGKKAAKKKAAKK